MFDFLLRHFGKKQPDSIPPPAEGITARQAAAREARQAAIQQAEALTGDETEAVAFILQSASADARFIAAQRIHARSHLEQVRNALKNSDRRVTRLMQSRLDAISQREKQQEQIRSCIDTARYLNNEPHLHPSMVADLDRQWDRVEKTDDEISGLFLEYESIREAIGHRLADQAALQRQIMDTLSALRQLEEEEAALTPPEREGRLAALLALSEGGVLSPEWAALPRHLINEFEEAKQRLESRTQSHRQYHETLAARLKLLEVWENADLTTLELNDLQQQWQMLPAASDDDRLSGLQERFEALVMRCSGAGRPEQEGGGKKIASTQTESRFANSLTLMKKAIEEGAVREAIQQNERITHMDFSAFDPTPEQKAMLTALRAELRHLADWARWGGQASREELLRIVEALPGKEYPLEELAAAVVDAREKWKALNESSGMASKTQWQQFDAACNRAYEPVMEYARSQAVAREQNREKAQALIDSVRERLSTLNLPPEEEQANGRALVEFQRQTQRAWQRIGPMTRKDRKRLSAELETVMHPLNAWLKEETKIERQRRQELIEAVRNLEPRDKNSGRRARQLQERWQERARAFPLDSREDQKLWEQFRRASEALFVQRSQLSEAAETARLESLMKKEALCEALETLDAQTAGKIQSALKEADAKWRTAGAVPKDQEKAIQARYTSAVETLVSRMQLFSEEETRRQAAALIEKLTLCQQVEIALFDQPELVDELKARWQAQPSDAWKKLLSPRFDAACDAVSDREGAYAKALKARQPELMEQLLRLEIAAVIDSPPEFAEKRRLVQLELLKDSLSGNRAVSLEDHLQALCAMPVLTDTATAGRIVTLVKKIRGLPD